MHRFCQNLALSANIGIKILNWKLWDFETLKFFATLTGTSHSRKLEPRSHSSFSKKTSTECVARNSKASENGAEHRRSPLVRRLFASLWSWQLSSLGSERRIFSFMSPAGWIFKTTESGHRLLTRFLMKRVIANWSKTLSVLECLSFSLLGGWCGSRSPVDKIGMVTILERS